MMTSRWATRTRRGYLGWLDLAAHEYFHAWNIKRLRPVELGPFDYENENPTRSLWIAEGITDYYAPLTVRRAGLSTTQEYLGTDTPPSPGSLSTTIASLQSTPGRLLQSAEQASYDAWIKLYRPDENSANTSISYYTKGAVVGWLLDARIRHATDGKKSLDDLMRLAFEQFSGDHGYTPEQFRATAEQVAGQPLEISSGGRWNRPKNWIIRKRSTGSVWDSATRRTERRARKSRKRRLWAWTPEPTTGG